MNDALGPSAEGFGTSRKARNPFFVSFGEDMVYSSQYVRSVEQRFQKIDLCALYVDFQHADIFVQFLKILDEIHLTNFNNFLRIEIIAAGKDRARLGSRCRVFDKFLVAK